MIRHRPTPPPPPPRKSSAYRRSQRRFAVEGVSGNLRYNFGARILNISTTGVALETSHWLEVGHAYPLKIQGKHGETLSLAGEVAWCRLLRTEKNDQGDVLPIYDAGLSFEDTFAPKGQELISFIEDHASVGLEGKRLTGRFQSRLEEAVSIDLRHTFVAREISRSEVLIEADLLPETGTIFRIRLGDGNSTLDATVRVERVRPLHDSEGRPTSEIKLRFVGLQDGAVAALEDFIGGQVRDASGDTAVLLPGANGGGTNDAETATETGETYVGTESSKRFHRAGCPHAAKEGRPFAARREAVDAGFRPAGCCEP